TSAGPGMADLPCVAAAPISLTYSGSILTVVPVPCVASCHAPIITPNRTTDTSAARRASHVCISCGPPPVRSRCPLDGEALDVLVGLGWIERLAHHDEGLGGGGGRRQADLGHEFGRVGGEEHLLGHTGVVDLALDLPPAFHLR